MVYSGAARKTSAFMVVAATLSLVVVTSISGELGTTGLSNEGSRSNYF